MSLLKQLGLPTPKALAGAKSPAHAGTLVSKRAAEGTGAGSGSATTARKGAAVTKGAKPGSSRSSVPSTNASLVVDNFAFAGADVPAGRMGELKNLRERLAAAPKSTVLLVGHTDTVGTERNNRKLGLQRTMSVRAFLIAQKGVDAGHFKLDSAGETLPAAGEPASRPDPDKGEKNSRNRRVEIFVTWSNALPVPVTGKTPAKPGQPTDPAKPPPVVTTDPPARSGTRPGITFEHQWDSKEFGNWRLAYVKGSFRVKAKFKGELVQKGSGGKVTAGYTTNKGEKGLIQLGQQKAVQIFEGLSLKEVTETFEQEFSAKKVELKFQIKATLQTGVSWLSPVVSGSFILVAAEWKKLETEQGGFKVATFTIAGGVQAKGTIDVNDDWEAKLSVELLAEGSAGPNWPAIAAKVAEVIATDAAEAAAVAEGAAEGGSAVAEGVEGGSAVVSFEALIAGGFVVLGASVIAGTLKTIVDGEEIRNLGKTVDKTTRAFRRGYSDAMIGEKEPGDPLAKTGYELGKKNFEQSKRAALAKYPLTNKELRSALRAQIRESWDRLYWVFHPYAQQAVWDTFGSSYAGWVNRNIDPSTIRWGYGAIYGHNPDENDPNYTKYYLK